MSIDQKMITTKKIERLAFELLQAIGEDPTREGLKDTPRRVAKFWDEFINYEPGNIATSFAQTNSGQIVIVSGMRVWSLCEHHLLPFWCDVSIAYRPADKILGLSKFARIALKQAHKLNVQENLVRQIADEVGGVTGSADIAVVGVGVHTCMLMRGVEKAAHMTTIEARGSFQNDLATLNTLLQFVSRPV